MVNELAVGYVSIVPETTRIGSMISRELAGVERSAGTYGRRIGDQLRQGMAKAKPIDVSELEQSFATAEKSRAALVKRTTAEVEGLRRKEAIAQAQLTEAEGKYAANSVQVLRAKDRLATASQKVALAEAKQQVEIAKADETLGDAKKALDDYATAVNQTGSRSAGAFRGITAAAGTMAKGTLSAVSMASKGNWSGLATGARGVFSSIVQQANGLGATIGNTLGNAGRGIGTTFRKIATGDVAGAFNDMKAAAGTAASGVKGAFSRMGNLFAPLVKFGAKAGVDSGRSFSSSATGAFKSAGSAAGSAFRSTLGALLTSSAITSILGGVKSAITGLMPEVISASDATDKFVSTLNFAGLDTKTIDALKASTKDYADKTVYDLADIQSTTAQLAANGVKGYASLAEAAGNLNAVAGGNAETFKSVGTVLTQTAGQGKLTTENFNQLADAIPGASGMLQEAMLKNGAYTGNFREAMEKGEITADEFNKAISDLGMTDAAKDAATATTTFEGAVGNLQATVVSGLSEPLNTLKPAITTAIGGISTILEPVFAKIGSLVEGIAPKIEGLAKRFSESAGNFSLEGISRPFGPLVKILDGAREAVGGFVQGFGGVKGLASTFGPLVGLLTGPLGLIKTALLDTFKGADVASIGQTLGATLKPIIGLIAQVATTIQGALAGALRTLMPVFGQLVTTLLPMLTGLFQQLVPTISSVVTAIVPLVAQFIAQLAPVLIQLIGQVLPPVIALIQQLVPVILQVVAAVVPLVAQLASALVPVIGAVVGAIVPLISQLVAGLAPIITMLVQTIIPPLTQILGVVAQVVQTVVVPVLTFLAGFLTNVLSVAFKILTPVVQTVFNVIGTIIKTAVGVITTVIKTGLSLINGNWRDVWNGIKSFVSGIWDGIKSAVSGGIGAVSKTIGDIMSTIKTGWDVAWNGIKDLGSKAWSWISDTATKTFDTMKGAVEDTFTRMRDGIGSIWEGLKKVFATPINAVIRFINDGVIGSYNWVADEFKMGKLSTLKTLPGYKSGGLVDLPWSSRRRDPYLGVTPNGAFRFEGEEFFVRRSSTLKLEREQPGLLDYLNRYGELPGHAGGGRVQFQGKTFTAQFVAAMRNAMALFGRGFHISQGGFRPRTSYSGTSHAGDAVDITSPVDNALIAALRKSGIAAWDRTGKGKWAPHIHGVPLPGFGSPGGSAVWQAQDYLRGGDGLGGRDNGPRGGGIMEVLKGLAEAIAAGFNSVKDWFTAILDKVTGPLQSLGSVGGGVLGDLVVGIGNKLKSDLETWLKDKLGVGGYATGTRSAAPGLAWVGERGPELVNFRGGEQVLPPGFSPALTAGAAAIRIGQLNLQLPDWVRDFDTLIRFIRDLELQAHSAR